MAAIPLKDQYECGCCVTGSVFFPQRGQRSGWVAPPKTRGTFTTVWPKRRDGGRGAPSSCCSSTTSSTCSQVRPAGHLRLCSYLLSIIIHYYSPLLPPQGQCWVLEQRSYRRTLKCVVWLQPWPLWPLWGSFGIHPCFCLWLYPYAVL